VVITQENTVSDSSDIEQRENTENPHHDLWTRIETGLSEKIADFNRAQYETMILQGESESGSFLRVTLRCAEETSILNYFQTHHLKVNYLPRKALGAAGDIHVVDMSALGIPTKSLVSVAVPTALFYDMANLPEVLSIHGYAIEVLPEQASPDHRPDTEAEENQNTSAEEEEK
jgi:hypothetical protein